MRKKLVKLMKKSYSPYSKVKVASIVETNNKDFYEGVNIENAAYPSTICAERVALFNAISNGAKKKEIESIHLMSTSEHLMPCGACLQVMLELTTLETKVITYGKKDKKIYTLKELIPYGPTKKDF